MAVATARWLVLSLLVSAAAAAHDTKWKAGAAVGGQVVEKERRRVVAESEAGTVTATDVADAAGTVYRLQFITMDPGALFLPVQLHADAVFYVHSGRGKVTYIQEGGSETSSLEVQRGDVYNLEQGSILYIQSYPNATRERLRIYAIFTSNAINCDDPSVPTERFYHPTSEAYSSVSNLLRGFDVKILRQGFGVSGEVVEAIQSAKSPQLIIMYNPDQEKKEKSNWTEEIFDALWGDESPLNKKKKKDKHKKKDKKDDKSKSETFNFYSGKPDVKNCFGWSKTMTNKDLQNLKGSNIGMFMVNLTTGSMMGPHWNPKATEIAIVTQGSGIVQVVCPSTASGAGGGHGHHDEGGRGGGDHGHHDEGGRRRGDHGHHDEGGRRGGDHGQGGVECKNSVFRVKEGDVFVVPRFHPMAQLSFNNGSFVFVGFSTHMGENNPQFLAGEHSVLQVIGKEIVALALGQKNTTAVEQLLSAKSGSTIMACISCAEELERKAEKEEQEGGKGEREREEEEERERKQREEEERKKREEEERARREEEERARREEERKKREEEEQRKREEEERKRREQEEEEERRRREEEEGGGGQGGGGGDDPREEEERRREEEEGGGGQGGGGDDPREEEEERRRREEEEGGGGQGGRGDDPREEEERRREEEGGRGGRGGDDPWEEEEGDWGDSSKYRAATNLKKRYRGRKGAVFQSA
ncbi:hypothetical protein CFC21_062683 [Triticum aestivum]|uniref:Cupin type-1 domain-containing protein n=2 Tax=Triticum aestivum TaxID=4565 RepID=A0A9R1GYM5_WHEAT|nr:hypothetical protein CFC21_062683 [Triticum aestivum]